jgi:branched-chain amino acid transport system ATP-binding protein
MLWIDNLEAFYGKMHALWGVSLRIEEREIVALIGANGAGKTTLVNTLTGLLRPATGKVSFLGTSLVGLAAHEVAALGVSHVPEGGRVFPEMSVRENLEMGAYPLHAWKRKEESFERVYGLFPRLKERKNQLARTLSGGEKQMLAMGRALMARPKLCLFDEPSYGLAPILVLELFRIIASLREQGLTVLLIEQSVRHALEIADRAYVLENGHIVSEGNSRALLKNKHIKKAYLGL